MKIGVLVSGRGSNLQALLDADLAGGTIAVVVSNIAGVQALERAKKHGVATEVLEHKKFADRVAFERALVEVLHKHGVELVCLAGFFRILTPVFLDAFPQRVLNIHPSLLPAFPGMHGAKQAVEHGARFSGCTVHFVDPGTDSGPIVIQAAVPVLLNDDEAALSARILEAEHRVYPEAVRLVVSGRAKLEGRRVTIEGYAPPPTAPLYNPDLPRSR